MTRPNPDIRFRVVPFDTVQPPGSQGFYPIPDTCNEGGKAVLNFCSGQVPSAAPTESLGAKFSIGFTPYDGVGTPFGHGVGSRSANGVTPTSNFRLWNLGSNISNIMHKNTGFFPYASLGGMRWPSSGQIIVDYPSGDSVSLFRGFLVNIFGDQVVQTAPSGGVPNSLGTGTSPITFNVGAAVDLVIVCSATSPSFESTPTPYSMQFGMATKDGTQFSICQEESSGVAAGRPAQIINNDCIYAKQNPTAAGTQYKVTIGNFTSTSFDLTPSSSAGNDNVLIIAFKLTGARVKLWSFSTPTVTGNVADTSPGFKPAFGLIVGSSLESFNTSKFNDPLAGGFQISAFHDYGLGQAQYASSVRIKQGANPTNTASNTVPKALSIPSDSASGVVQATLTSMDANGWTLNYSAVAAAPKMCFVLAVEYTDPICDIDPVLAPVYGVESFGIAGDVTVEIPTISGPTIIPAYPYVQYNDDDDIQAFFGAYNEYAQAFSDWFYGLHLPDYTYEPISGALLDWVAKGLYGMGRPSISYFAGEFIGPLATFGGAVLGMATEQNIGQETQQVVDDDVFRRILTWHIQKSYGKNFDVRWLKRRIIQFLKGPNGEVFNIDQTYEVSVTFGPGNQVNINFSSGTWSNIAGAFPGLCGCATDLYAGMTATFTRNTSLNGALLKAAIQSGALELPFQFKYVVNL